MATPPRLVPAAARPPAIKFLSFMMFSFSWTRLCALQAFLDNHENRLHDIFCFTKGKSMDGKDWRAVRCRPYSRRGCA